MAGDAAMTVPAADPLPLDLLAGAAPVTDRSGTPTVVAGIERRRRARDDGGASRSAVQRDAESPNAVSPTPDATVPLQLGIDGRPLTGHRWDTADGAPNDIPELTSAENLRDADAVLAQLRATDWAFAGADTRARAHDVHPYPAKFIPQIPAHLIAALSVRGDLVLDPFGGSGTTAVEAVRLGRRVVSVDANPLACLLGRVKTAHLAPAARAALAALGARTARASRHVPRDAGAGAATHASYVPQIPNVSHWFAPAAVAELAWLRAAIADIGDPTARDVAALAFSRGIVRASFQDSETRYAARKREVAPGETLAAFARDLSHVVDRVTRADDLQYGAARFVLGDARTLGPEVVADETVDLVVTSPPYGNATDYHLYHRFRMFWLGYDPRDLGQIEIGSHLRHQRDGTGLDAYIGDMRAALVGVRRALRPGRYAVLVIGSSVYDGQHADCAGLLTEVGAELGFEALGRIPRALPTARRAFGPGARRLTVEDLVVLRKPPRPITITLEPAPYRMWPYEQGLRAREVAALLGALPVQLEHGPSRPAAVRVTPLTAVSWDQPITLACDPYRLADARRLVFTHAVTHHPLDAPAVGAAGAGGIDAPPARTAVEATWQRVLENGSAADPAARKNPKYVTHGLHPYKGKFYPQLAKGLLNAAGVGPGARVLDPFCGSGTTLLEGRLNGLHAAGCDLHPLAAKIARAKVGVLDLAPHAVLADVAEIRAALAGAPRRFPDATDAFAPHAVPEIRSWFPAPVIRKLNWLLTQLRALTSGVFLEFCEVVVSSGVREVSHQDEGDLRIRRRKEPIADADLLGRFRDRLEAHVARLEKFWTVRSQSPCRLHPAHVVHGDARDPATYAALGLAPASVDLVLTSPPYATALPYIDTDRLSLLTLFGMTSADRRPVEHRLTGSREITTSERRAFETTFTAGTPPAGDAAGPALPPRVLEFVRTLQRDHAGGGFRRQNLPALLTRFCIDMRSVFACCATLLRPGGEAIVVIGDNATLVDGARRVIPTTEFLVDLATAVGLELHERVPITVTTEALPHVRHAITTNTVLRFRSA